MNAMVAQYDKTIFGEDSYEYRPERWLESEERWRAMDRAMLVYGAGTRTCAGKHVSVDFRISKCQLIFDEARQRRDVQSSS